MPARARTLSIVATATSVLLMKDASPAKPVLSDNHSDTHGTFPVTANTRWGTNATSAQFYLGGMPVGSPIAPTSATPNARVATLAVTGKPKGTYAYSVIFTNPQSSTTSATLTEKVTK